MSYFGDGTAQQMILDSIESIEPDVRKATALVAEVLAYLANVAQARN